ncbi:ribosome-binding factor A [bacterium]|nr:ribosome-binding factor A [bacterium]
MATFRKQRVQELVFACLSSELRSIGQPGLELVSIQAVKMSQDLRGARVFWSALPLGAINGCITEAEQRDIELQLEAIKGQLRYRLGKELHLRYTPEIYFQFDPTPAAAEKMDLLLDRVSGDKR